MMLTCRACGVTSEFKVFSAREMQLGTREVFQYGECPNCLSLQITEIPPELGKFYPKDYYSLQPPPERSKKPTFFKTLTARWLLGGGALAAKVAKDKARRYPFFAWCRTAGAHLNSRLVDVGCGSGGLLRRMQRYGFSNLLGVDPFGLVEVDEPGFKIRCVDFAKIPGPFDLIMMHHVLEHLPDPVAGLVEASDRLAPQGRILVRIPVANSETYRKYRENWYNLDPPRHLLIPSPKGMQILAERSGLKVADAGFDGIEVGYLYSEFYQADIPFSERPESSKGRKAYYRALADAANARGEGDQGVFFLEKK